TTIGFEIEVDNYQKSKNLVRPEGNLTPKANESNSVVYERSAQVKAWVLDRASGHCELCDNPAPFATPSGKPYLEVHHVKRLSENGSDTVENCVALCPNCHRLLHFSSDKAIQVEQLYQKIPALTRE
ncbi:HNH endonuclease, partial [Photobacterium sp. SP02]|uniref:HNH endonuclease n=1 Tax=Photobacterium sp. SP02 TaxID=3032280 RepID=UPI0031450F89